MNGLQAAKKILVMLPNPMGDAILSGPALRYLRRRRPESAITLLGNPTVIEILRGNPWSDACLAWPAEKNGRQGFWSAARWLREFQFDAVILLPNSFRSAALAFAAGIPRRLGYGRDGRGFLVTDAIAPIRIQGRFPPMSMLDYYGYLMEQTLSGGPENHYFSDGLHLELFTGPQDRQQAEDLLQRWGIASGRKLVMLVPGGAFGGSKWWPAERFAAVADWLTEKGYTVVVSCAPNETEKKIAAQILSRVKKPIFNLVEEGLPLGGFKELIRRCALVISNDTGPCHIAAGFQVPLVTLFGPTDPRWTATGYPREIRLRLDVPCGPCQQDTCLLDHRCLQQIRVDEVLAAVRAQLERQAWDTKPAPVFGTYYAPYAESFMPLPDGCGLVHKDYRDLLVQNQLAAPEEVFAFQQGLRLEKPGLGRRERIRIELPCRGTQVVLYLKRYGKPSLGQMLRRWVSGKRKTAAADSDFYAAMQLAEHGIPVPRPVAVGRQRNRLGERRSFVLMEELPQGEALERLLPRRQEKKPEYALLREERTLIEQTAGLVRRLHEGGFYHRDLYLSHIFLCRAASGGEKLCLIDLQRVIQPRLFRRRWQVKDLAQLYYSSRSWFRRTDILRFLQFYFSCNRLTGSHKKIIRAVERKTRRMIRHEANRCKRYQTTS